MGPWLDMMYQFANHNNFTIQLPDQFGNMVVFAKGQRRILDDFFRRYVPKHLTLLKTINEKIAKTLPREMKTSHRLAPIVHKQQPAVRLVNEFKAGMRKVPKLINQRVVGRANFVGRHATEFSVARVKENAISISNNIGVGILSYNRLPALIHLIESIRKHTDLTRTTVFVSDESTDPKVWEWLREQKDIVGIHSDERIGIAGNSNRLLRCLARFKYKLLLNDDVEVLKPGWDDFYFSAMVRTNYKHFCYRQEGVYGATRPTPKVGIINVEDRPHGAVMAFHHEAFKKVGYFDEAFGFYGFEHVDYSDRIAKAGLQPHGYPDYVGSDQYFKIYPDQSSDEQKLEHFAKARGRYEKVKLDAKRIFIDTSAKTDLPSISYVIPFRDIGRAACLNAVVANVRSQKFPIIQIVLVEQDAKQKTNLHEVGPVDFEFVANWLPNMQFCKSVAFNRGSFRAKHDIILHDADMLVRSDYTSMMAKLLTQNESVHIGNTVCYMDESATSAITTTFIVNEASISSDRIVNYYEGGSLGIKRDVYFRIGGFIEDFIGYGCEDTEFFHRIKNATKLFNERTIDLFHLWHGRTPGWEACHDANKDFQARIFAMGTDKVVSRYAPILKNNYERWKSSQV